MSITTRDNSLIWHPFSDQKTKQHVIKIGEGSYLFDEDGEKYLDLVSSWWVNIHGHCNPVIAKAIYDQALTLDHVMFAGFTHEPAVKLCSSIKELLPSNLSKFFFSDNGSTSVEVAIKVAYRYFKPEKRKLFLNFDKGYHGDTFGSMSLGNKSGYHDEYEEFFFDVLTVPFPDFKKDEDRCLSFLDTILKIHGNNICAFIIEPLVQGASGMRMCSKEFINEAILLTKNFGILTIFDEVMTGFGRTGTYFALDQIESKPDLLCISKGISGGFLPIALTVVSDDVYKKCDHYFTHSHSYMANPIACAAANASISLLKDAPIPQIIEAQHAGLLSLQNVTGKRQTGTITAFEVKDPIKLKEQAFKKGLIIRPIKNSCYIMPPYSTKIDDLDYAYEVLNELIDH